MFILSYGLVKTFNDEIATKYKFKYFLKTYQKLKLLQSNSII